MVWCETKHQITELTVNWKAPGSKCIKTATTTKAIQIITKSQCSTTCYNVVNNSFFTTHDVRSCRILGIPAAVVLEARQGGVVTLVSILQVARGNTAACDPSGDVDGGRPSPRQRCQRLGGIVARQLGCAR